MTGRFSGRVAMVTGAARGIGEGIARRLGSEGAKVLLVDFSEELSGTVERFVAEGHQAVAMPADISDAEAVSALARSAVSAHGRLDILVNNAGISPKKDGRKFFVEELDLAGWEQVIRVNLTGAFLLSQACIPALQRSDRGRIINVISQSARTRPGVTSAHYAASKSGLMGFTRALANELGGAKVTVNSVAPGLIDTPMFRAYTPEQRDEAVKNVPIRRFGTPKDVAGAVAFLASEDADYITGTVIDVNGGLFMT